MEVIRSIRRIRRIVSAPTGKNQILPREAELISAPGRKSALNENMSAF